MKKQSVKPLVDELNARLSPLSLPKLQAKPQSAELDQDPGGSYNTSHVYPQT